MTTRPNDGRALTELIQEIFQVNGKLLKFGNQVSKPFGLTSARWQVLRAIEDEDRPLTVSQIARRMGLARQGLQRLVNELLKLGFLNSETNIDHRRAPLFLLSEQGANAMAKVNSAQADWVNELAVNLDQKQINDALDLLRTIQAKLDED